MAARKKTKDEAPDAPATLQEAAQIAAREEFSAPVYKTKRYLPCRLTSDELILLGEKLVARERDVARNDMEKKAAMKAFGEKDKAFKGEIITIGSLIDTKVEERSVEVEWFVDPDAMTMRCVRVDTGAEIRGRDLTESERQLVLRSNGRAMFEDILSREPLPGTFEDGDEEPADDRQIALPLATEGATAAEGTPAATDENGLNWSDDDEEGDGENSAKSDVPDTTDSDDSDDEDDA